MSDAGENYWEPCWACRVAGGEYNELVVFENSDVIAAINPFSLSPGHSLVMPRSHIRNLYELPDENAGPILSAAARIARAAKRAFRADGITLRQNNDAASDQHLFHFHLHVIPRFEGDTERFEAEAQLSDTKVQEDAASTLRGALSMRAGDQ